MKRAAVAAIVILLLASPCALAQPAAQSGADREGGRFVDVTVGMGIDLHSATSLFNYINLMAQPRADEKLFDFSSAMEFYAVPEMQISDAWGVGLEYALLLKSYAIDDRSGFSRSEFSYQIHMPTFLLHRLLLGDGYRVKLGGGIGYHVANFTQNFPTVGSEETVTAKGFAVKLDAVGNTRFDDTFYGSIGIDLRWDFEGTLKRGPGSVPTSSTSVALPTINFFSAGLKFGVTFQLN